MLLLRTVLLLCKLLLEVAHVLLCLGRLCNGCMST